MVTRSSRFEEESLPIYSTERYYALAQIQSRESDLVFTEMSAAEAQVEGYAETFRSRLKPGSRPNAGGGGAKEDSSISNFGDSTSRVSIAVAYVLVVLRDGFDVENEVAALVGRFRALASHPAASGTCGPRSQALQQARSAALVTATMDLTRMLEVDVLAIPPVSPQKAQNFSRIALKRLDAVICSLPTPFVGRAISLSDKAEACPGIERIASRYAERLPLGALRVVARDRDELMGVVPDCEPDAVQGVTQLTVGDVNPQDVQAPALRSAKLWLPSAPSASTYTFFGPLALFFVNGTMAIIFLSALLGQLPRWPDWKFLSHFNER